jgi:hypothetical protein
MFNGGCCFLFPGLQKCRRSTWMRASSSSCERRIVRSRCLLQGMLLFFLKDLLKTFFKELHSTTQMLTTRTHTHLWIRVRPLPLSTSEGLSTDNGDSRSHHWYLVVDGNVTYHLTHDAGKSQINPRKDASTRIWTLVGSAHRTLSSKCTPFFRRPGANEGLYDWGAFFILFYRFIDDPSPNHMVPHSLFYQSLIPHLFPLCLDSSSS